MVSFEHLFILLLITAAAIDFKYRIVPDIICILIAVISVFNFHFFGMIIAIPFLFSVLKLEGSIGGGDVKLVATIGLFLGLQKAVLCMIVSLSLFIIVGLIKGNKSLPLAPFFLIGAVITIYV